MRIADIDFWENVIQGPNMLLWSSSMHHDDKRPFASQEIDKKLKKGIDGEGLVDITHWVYELCQCERYEGYPGRYRVDGNHEQNSDDISLEKGFSIVFKLEPYR